MTIDRPVPSSVASLSALACVAALLLAVAPACDDDSEGSMGTETGAEGGGVCAMDSLACGDSGTSMGGGDTTAGTGTEEGTCATDTRAEPYRLPKIAAGSAVQATLEFGPPNVSVGDNNWEMLLTDANGQPMTGAQLGIRTWMPDHEHGSPSDRLIETSELGAGRYKLDKVNLFMTGFWEVNLDVYTADSSLIETVQFTFCID